VRLRRSRRSCVGPKLGGEPNGIVRRQVECHVRYDRAGIMSRSATGHEAPSWASDHPRSQEVPDRMFDGIGITKMKKATSSERGEPSPARCSRARRLLASRASQLLVLQQATLPSP
jgi:hypothetical protein